MRERLAFLHLPKSAGTSYRHGLSAYYDRADTVPWSFDRWSFGDDRRMDDVPQPILLDESVDLSGYRYMEGHFSMPTILRGFEPGEVTCILREPRARLFSHFTFWRSWGQEMRDIWEPYDVADAAQQDFVDFCRDDRAAHQSDNLITRLIVGRHPLIPTDGMISAEHRAELIAVGIDRLDQMGFVDLLERGDDAFDAFEEWFGSPLDRQRLNETNLDSGPPLRAEHLVDLDAMMVLQDRTIIDLALWNHVAQRVGFTADDAQSLASATFGLSLARLVQHAVEPPEPEVNPEPDVDPEPVDEVAVGAVDAVERLPTVPRFVALIRRGPRAIAARIVDEGRHRLAQIRSK